MRFFSMLVLASGLAAGWAHAQSNAVFPVDAPSSTNDVVPIPSVPPASEPAATPATTAAGSEGGNGKTANSSATNANKTSNNKARAQSSAELQAALDRLTQSNRELLDLLKQQQAVLEDIQYDRRLQSRQIEQLEERLTESQIDNAKLQDQVTNLESAAAVHNSPTLKDSGAQSAETPSPTVANDATNSAPTTQASPPPTEPESYLPPAPEESADPGAKSWHRLFTLKGTDNMASQYFHVSGQNWRVVWHNLDKPGKMYAKTSALFINAFPKDDTIPQQVCSQLGTGGDATTLEGPGNYYLKIEASGGSWELAVEDFH